MRALKLKNFPSTPMASSPHRRSGHAVRPASQAGRHQTALHRAAAKSDKQLIALGGCEAAGLRVAKARTAPS